MNGSNAYDHFRESKEFTEVRKLVSNLENWISYKELNDVNRGHYRENIEAELKKIDWNMISTEKVGEDSIGSEKYAPYKFESRDLIVKVSPKIDIESKKIISTVINLEVSVNPKVPIDKVSYSVRLVVSDGKTRKV